MENKKLPNFESEKEKNNNVENFFEEIRTLSFFKKIFSWKYILDLREKANNSYIEFKNRKSDEKEKILKEENKKLELKSKNLEEKNGKLENKNGKLENENENLKNKYNKIDKENLNLIKNEEFKREQYEKQITSLNEAREDFNNDKIRIQEEKEQEQEKKFEEMKKTWKNHEENCKNELIHLTKKLNIEYIEKSPFKGTPDNIIKIADEYIIFDAKSPAGENLNNFPKYIKIQVDNLKKYFKEKNVKNELFLIIPNNTIDKIKNFFEETGDYKVYIITLNSLVPILLSLKKNRRI